MRNRKKVLENIRLSNFNLNNDIKAAQAIINGEIDNSAFVFNKYFPICKLTNEDVSHPPYLNNLKNRERVLSIIGSGDQIINAIFCGAKDVVGIDISFFPKYFLPLKLAAIKVFNRSDYLEYFYGISKPPFLPESYRIIQSEVNDDVRQFWDNIYNKYNNIYHSPLFYNLNISVNCAIKSNPFLSENNYDDTKKYIDKVSVELMEYDMFNAKKLNMGLFDLILLSNIINNKENIIEPIDVSYYNELFIKKLKKYKAFLKTLPLNKDGIAITYNLAFNGEIKEYFKECEYEVYKILENAELFTCENEILIYKKSLHK